MLKTRIISYPIRRPQDIFRKRDWLKGKQTTPFFLCLPGTGGYTTKCGVSILGSLDIRIDILQSHYWIKNIRPFKESQAHFLVRRHQRIKRKEQRISVFLYNVSFLFTRTPASTFINDCITRACLRASDVQNKQREEERSNTRTFELETSFHKLYHKSYRQQSQTGISFTFS